jgi:alcohol dehydrogenase class IV
VTATRAGTPPDTPAGLGLWRFALPTRVIFGVGCSLQAGAVAASFGRRAALVTGATSIDRQPTATAIISSLADAGIEVVAHVRQGAEPDDEAVTSLAQHLRSVRADVVVAIGGGSALDTAKAAAVIAGTNLSLGELLAGRRVESHVGLPVVALPTTGGSGAEVSHGAIVLDRAAHRKRGMRGPGVSARVALIDPALLAGAAPSVTAAAGFDAMAHAIETFVSRAATPLTKALSTEALRRLALSLPAALDDAHDVAAREQTAYASFLMGVNLANSTTCLPHRLQYPVGALTGTSHPRGVAALMPAWLRRTRLYAPDRLADLAVGAGLARAETSIPLAAEQLEGIVERFIDEIGFRITLSELGVAERDLGSLVDATEGSLEMDPGPVTRNALMALYRSSL